MGETLFWILIALYLAYRALQGIQRPRQQPTGEPASAGEAEALSLEDALREIREALSGPPPASADAAPTPPEARPAPLPEEAPQPTHATHGAGDVFHDEEVFEESPIYDAPEAPDLDAPLAAAVAPITPPSAPRADHREQGAAPLPRTLRQRLRDPDAAREAILLSEILGPPRSRQRPLP